MTPEQDQERYTKAADAAEHARFTAMTPDEERVYVQAAEAVERLELAMHTWPEPNPLHGRDLTRVCVNCGRIEGEHAFRGDYCPTDVWFDYRSRFQPVAQRELDDRADLIATEEEEWAMTHCLTHGEPYRDDGTGTMYCPVCQQELEDERIQDR